jgi:hypothetical protein
MHVAQFSSRYLHRSVAFLVIVVSATSQNHNLLSVECSQDIVGCIVSVAIAAAKLIAIARHGRSCGRSFTPNGKKTGVAAAACSFSSCLLIVAHTIQISQQTTTHRLMKHPHTLTPTLPHQPLTSQPTFCSVFLHSLTKRFFRAGLCQKRGVSRYLNRISVSSTREQLVLWLLHKTNLF